VTATARRGGDEARRHSNVGTLVSDDERAPADDILNTVS
jgi:hypothetical protein